MNRRNHFLLLPALLAALLAAPAGAAGQAKPAPQFALTYDDGPGAVTGELLDLLAKRGVKATFFMLGSSVRRSPDLAKRAHDAGHLLANHTDSHKNWFKIGKGPDRAKILEAEIKKAEEALVKAAGFKPGILRMPNGYAAQWVTDTARKLGYRTANWSYGSDWTKVSEEKMTAEYLKALKPGAVLLLHDGGGRSREKTLRITAAVLDEAASRGLQPARLDALLPFPRE